MNVKKAVHYIFIVVCAVIFIGSIAVSVRTCFSNRHLREVSERYRVELSNAVDTNTELRRKLEESRRILEDCRGTTAELRDTAAKGVSTARGAIELLRDIREKVVLLESRLSDSNDISNSDDSCTPSNEVDECQK